MSDERRSTHPGRRALRQEVEAAHRHVQNAQRIVYDRDGPPLRRRVPYALNRAHTILLKLLVHEGWPR